jgi:NAD(P)-dependent dehydrogenase (short-subunit alcohol dehydrogenase family)
VAATITAEGGTARFVAADLSDPAQLDDLAGHADAVDVLVNNAAQQQATVAGQMRAPSPRPSS